MDIGKLSLMTLKKLKKPKNIIGFVNVTADVVLRNLFEAIIYLP